MEGTGPDLEYFTHLTHHIQIMNLANAKKGSPYKHKCFQNLLTVIFASEGRCKRTCAPTKNSTENHRQGHDRSPYKRASKPTSVVKLAKRRRHYATAQRLACPTSSSVSPSTNFAKVASVWSSKCENWRTQLRRNPRNETPEAAHQGTPPGGDAPTIIDTEPPLYVTPLDQLGELPAYIDCPYCSSRTQTRVTHKDSISTTFVNLNTLVMNRQPFGYQSFADDGQNRLAGAICFLLTCVFACVPCLFGWFQDTDHHCSRCNCQFTHKPHDGPVNVILPPSGDQVTMYGNRNRRMVNSTHDGFDKIGSLR